MFVHPLLEVLRLWIDLHKQIKIIPATDSGDGAIFDASYTGNQQEVMQPLPEVLQYRIDNKITPDTDSGGLLSSTLLVPGNELRDTSRI